MSVIESGNAPDLRSMRIGAVLNTASGSCDIEAEHEMQALLKDAGLEAQKIWCGGADQVADALREASSHELDVLIVLGGDGTIRAAAEPALSGVGLSGRSVRLIVSTAAILP